MPQFAQCLGFNLANTFTSDIETTAYLLEGVFRAILHTETHSENLLLTRAESAQCTSCSFPHVGVYDRVCRRNRRTIFDEVAETRISLHSDWRLQRNWGSHNLDSVTHPGFRDI